MLSILSRNSSAARSTVSSVAPTPIARVLFMHPRLAGLWLVVRLYLGIIWVSAGFEKLTGRTPWGAPVAPIDGPWLFTGHDGAALRGFLAYALMKAPGGKLAGPHPDVQTWYAAFLQNVVIPHATLFTYLITFGELAVGIGLIVGGLTVAAAGFGVGLNLMYLLAGSVSINPFMLLLEIGVVLAWRIAGNYGVDGLVALMWRAVRTRMRDRRARSGFGAGLPPLSQQSA